MRKLIPVLALVAVVAFAATAFGSGSTVSWKFPTTKTVKIKKGASVKWVWAGDGLPHSVQGRGFSSKESSKKGFAYSHKFGKKGTFTIICGVHGAAMKTVVKVS